VTYYADPNFGFRDPDGPSGGTVFPVRHASIEELRRLERGLRQIEAEAKTQPIATRKAA
jgi:hypothetical protein